MGQRNVLTIFLASPGDLMQERDETRQIVQRLNKSTATPLNWQIDLLGWEDTSPGYSRPQEKINADVDKCDLFIGMLWKRWGSETGTHTSGFFEEFERALERRRKTKAPEIWLFFKKVPEDQLRDPGEQLRQVLSFRKLQEEQRELLFNEFGDTTEWSQKLLDWLAAHIIQLSTAASPSHSASSPPVQFDTASPETTPTPPKDRNENEEAKRQISQVMHAFLSSVEQSTLFSQLESVDHFAIARLNLFSSSWLSENYSHEILAPHDINLLYQERDRVTLFHAERLMILRTLIGNSEATAPGWYWFQANSKDYLLFMLSALAQNDSNSEIRKHSIRLLAALKKAPDKRLFIRQEFFRRLLEEVPREASDYIATIGSLSDLPVLEGKKTAESIQARICILARIQPDTALQELSRNHLTPSEVALKHIKDKSSELEDKTLLKAMHSSSDAIRSLAFEELRRRGSLTREHILEALEDKAKEVRKLALEQLISEGAQIEPGQIRDLLKRDEPARAWLFLEKSLVNPDEVVRKALFRLSSRDLEKLITWPGLDGSTAYAVLAELYFEAAGDTVREDLRTGFSRVKEQWASELRSIAGTETDRHVGEMSKYDDLIRGRFTISALTGLKKNGTPHDRSLVTPFLNSNDPFVVTAAIDALRNLGSRDDAEALLNIALTGTTLARTAAASAAVHLAPGINGPAADLLTSNDIQLVTIALRSLEAERLANVTEQVEALLLHPQDSIRERALAFLVKRGTRKYLLGLLGRYLEKEKYFYNVVCHLDRNIYSPKPFREHFRQTLIGVLGS